MSRILSSFGPAVIAAGFAFASSTAAHATPSICDADAGNLVANCGFEGGVYTNGSGDTNVPDDWIAVGAWNNSYNGTNVGSGIPNSGNQWLGDGNYPASSCPCGLAGAQQTITDVSGDVYQLSFYLRQSSTNGPGDQAYQVYWDGQLLLNQDGVSDSTYTQFSYNVTGHGSDTLKFEGYSTSGYNNLDDVEVNFVRSSSIPEPTSLSLLSAALVIVSLGIVRRRGRKATGSQC